QGSRQEDRGAARRRAAREMRAAHDDVERGRRRAPRCEPDAGGGAQRGSGGAAQPAARRRHARARRDGLAAARGRARGRRPTRGARRHARRHHRCARSPGAAEHAAMTTSARKKHVEPVESDEAREVAAAERAGERTWQAALRPRTFEEYIGQREMIDNLRISVRAAKENRWTLDHFLFAGPPGLGKTTLAHVIANELGVKVVTSSGPAIDHKGVLASLLTSLEEGDALFI